jgi:hypothetical protein
MEVLAFSNGDETGFHNSLNACRALQYASNNQSINYFIMRSKHLTLLSALIFSLAFLASSCDKNETVTPNQSAVEGQKAGNQCTRIQDGDLVYAAGHYLEGQPLETGYDVFGYNYQAHMFNGYYVNAYLGRYGYPPYDGSDDYLTNNPGADNVYGWEQRDVQLIMKWNDPWLSNQDCDNNGVLDRHYGYPGYIGSGAWLTNHTSGSHGDCNFTEFIKIVAAPEGAYQQDGFWYSEDGDEIGQVIWGSFAIIQHVVNDPCGGQHGIQYLSEDHPGFGGW